jgi:integrase
MTKKPMLVPEALDKYYWDHARKKVVDLQNTEISMEHLKGYFNATPLNDIGVPECRAYLQFREDSGAKTSTAGRELGVLKAAANHAVRWKYISFADMPTFEMPKIEPTKGVWLFEDELNKLRLAAFEEGYKTYAFIDLCYFTGSRRDAIEKLTWDQVDLSRNRISLSKLGSKVTKKRRPTIPIDYELKPTLLHLHAGKTNEFVLGTNSSMVYHFERAAEKAGLLRLPARDGRPSAKLTPHMLRHSRATHLLQARKSPFAVANLLGDNVNTVLRVYGHHSADYLESVLAPNNPLLEMLG